MRTECARRHEGHGREAGTVDEHMDLRQVSTRTDRRRRMLSEDRREAASVVTPGSESPGRAEARTPRSYTAAARAEQQPRICQLIPERRWTLALWFLVTATVLVGHAALDATYHAANLQLSAIDLSPLTFQARPNLACSTTSLALLSAAGYAGLIVGLRRHKIDDYRGRYRIWYYVVLACGIGSLAALSGLDRTLQSGLLRAGQWCGVAPDAAWPVISWVLVLAAAGTRIGLEIWPSRGAVVTGLGAVAAWVCAELCRLDAWPFPAVELRELAVGVLTLASHLLVLLTWVVFARFVYLDAQGRFGSRRTNTTSTRTGWKLLAGRRLRSRSKTAAATPSRASKVCGEPKADPSPRASAAAEESRAKSAAEPRSSRQHPPDAASTRREPPTSDSTPTTRAADDEDDEDDEEVEPSTLSISRAERKRQRKDKRKQRRAA